MGKENRLMNEVKNQVRNEVRNENRNEFENEFKNEIGYDGNKVRNSKTTLSNIPIKPIKYNRNNKTNDTNKTISIYIVEDYHLLCMQYNHILSKEKDFEILNTFENAEDCIEALDNINKTNANTVNKTKPVNTNINTTNKLNTDNATTNNTNNDTKQPDIIIMDLGLPYMNGIQATKIIKDKYPDIKVIILTCHERREEVLACLSSKASGYILKNEEAIKDSIKKAIRTVYQGGMWLDKEIGDYALSTIPKPISYDFNNLYQKDENELREYITSLLSKREIETLGLITDGKTNDEIAQALTVSKNTIKMHVRNILTKLSVNDRIQAAVKAVRAKLF